MPRYALAALLTLLVCPVRAQVHVALLEQSRITIHGTSSINTFRCSASAVQGDGVFVPGATGVRGTVRVPVQRFDCGNPRMNRDLHEALNADTHPDILFTLSTVVLTEPDAPVPTRRLQSSGNLSISGTARPTMLHVDGQRLPDGTYRARGEVGLLMSDFGVTPPHALLGLIRVHDAITVQFDLYARVAPDPSTR